VHSCFLWLYGYCKSMAQYTSARRREYMREYRERLRQEYVAVLGGVCVVCGSRDDLEFDHIDPKTKSFAISGFFKSREKMLIELRKCQLLCSTHHAEKTMAQLKEPRPHMYTRRCGTPYMYSLGCRCPECREAKRLNNRKYL
jgi:hypothetical protein